MAILAWLRKVQNALHEYAEAIRNAEERKKKRKMERENDPLKVQAVVVMDEKTMASIAAQNEGPHTTQKSIKKATWAAFYAVAVYALVTALMWCAMLKQNRIASDALRRSTESFRLDERAWVEIEPITASPISPPDKNFPAGFSCNIYPKNVGKTVATSISVRAASTLKTTEFSADEMQSLHGVLPTAKNYTVNIGPEKVTESVDDRFPRGPMPKVLAPNTSSNAPFRISCQATKDYPSGGHEYTFVVGRIDYCDAFNVRHWKTFCFYVANPKGDVWNCQEGNDEDRNSEEATPRTTCGKPN